MSSLSPVSCATSVVEKSKADSIILLVQIFSFIIFLRLTLFGF